MWDQCSVHSVNSFLEKGGCSHTLLLKVGGVHGWKMCSRKMAIWTFSILWEHMNQLSMCTIKVKG